MSEHSKPKRTAGSGKQTKRQTQSVMPAGSAAERRSKDARQIISDLQRKLNSSEAKLRASEERHSLITQAVAEGVYEWDVERNSLWPSARLIEIFGFEGRELRAGDWNELVHPDDFPLYRAALRDCFRGITPRLDCEYRIRHNDGTYRWIEDRAVAVRNAAGWAIRLTGAIADISARKATEEALREALEQQTATAEVLGVINSSPGDLTPVFDAMLKKATTLCDAAAGVLWVSEGEHFRSVASRGLPGAFEEFLRTPVDAGPDTGIGRLRRGGSLAHIADMADGAGYRSGDALHRAAVDLGGVRSLLAVPLQKDGFLFGAFGVTRQEVRPFTDKQIALLQNFAAQAVIAMENARLITETREALEQQTATAEVLGVINSSPGDLVPVFEAMLERALRLCGASFGELRTYDGERFSLAATRGSPPAYAEYYARQDTSRYAPGTGPARLLNGEPFVHIPDLIDTEPYKRRDPDRLAIVEIAGARAYILVPLLQDLAVCGFILIYRKEPGPFSDKQISLLQSFAAQAVIAMENARLLGELRERTTDLQESLEYQTATSDVLKVISRSTVDLQPVLDTLLQAASRLCGNAEGGLAIRQGDAFRYVATVALEPDFDARLRERLLAPGLGSTVGRVALEGKIVQIPDIAIDAEYALPEVQIFGKIRTTLGVPLVRQGETIGVITLAHRRVELFTERQVELVRTFADQAVIAIENARLLDEIRQRQAELRVTFDNMVDGVAMFDEELRLAAWNHNFQELLDLPDEFLAEPHSFDDYIRHLTERGEFGEAEPETQIKRLRERIGDHYSFERTRPDGKVIEVRNNPMPNGGIVVIYSDITERKRSEEEIRAARDAAEGTLRELQTAQASLVHAQKMAALGQLTAGIAHEIKNPLNFVNNFAGLSVELLDELKEVAGPGIATLDEDARAEIDDTMKLLTGNLEKIAEHGQRADGIVRSMLEHSRGGGGERRAVDLNALIDEALNLAYHGARAQDQSFNITMEREFDKALAPLEVVPQDMTRVFLNLFGNGFYAASKRGDGAQHRPVLTVSTRELGEMVEIRVRDNGIGIAPEIRDKLFQPFVTTKPTGEGTGLGLSISYEIVTQQHAGTIEVNSEIGQFTEFTVRLPRGNARGAESGQ